MTLLAKFLVVVAVAFSVRAAERPNIVLILADDMGFSDIRSYGGEVDTPNIDRLATNGLRFTRFYNTARCCPTRASLLTGLYPHQAGVPHMVDNQRLPMEQRQLSRNAVTIAEVLRANGYQTAMSGKWHVSPIPNASTNGPLARGFDHFYGIIHGASSFYEPITLMHDQQTITNFPPGFFLTDAIASNAVNYIQQFATAKKRSSSMPPSPRRTGPCTRPRRTPKNIRNVTAAAGTSFAKSATNAKSKWASSTNPPPSPRAMKPSAPGPKSPTKTGRLTACPSTPPKSNAWTAASARSSKLSAKTTPSKTPSSSSSPTTAAAPKSSAPTKPPSTSPNAPPTAAPCAWAIHPKSLPAKRHLRQLRRPMGQPQQHSLPQLQTLVP